MPVSEITRSHVKLYLKGKAQEHPYAANRIRGTLHRLFTWANEMDLLEVNPLSGVRRPGFSGKKEPVRDHVLTHAEIRSIWNAIDLEQPVSQAFLRMLFYTGLRKSEVLSAQWEHVDLEAGVWRVPRTATKGGVRLDVPIIEPMHKLFEALKPFAGHRNYVFASYHATVDRPIAGISKLKARVMKNSETSGWQLHDVRRSVITNLSEMGVPADVLRALLGHTHSGALASYDHAKFALPKRKALERWAKKLDRIVTEKSADVVSIARQ